MKKQIPWKILKTQRILDEKYKKVDKELVQVPDGSKHEWFVDVMNPIVGIFALTKQGKVIINQQYKHGARAVVYELPHGLVEDGEDPKQAAMREFREETGYQAKNFKKIGEYFFGATGSNGIVHLYFAKDAIKISKPHNTPVEIIEPIEVTTKTLIEWVKQGKINTQGGLAGILLGLIELEIFETP